MARTNRHPPLTPDQISKVLDLYNQGLGMSSIGSKLRLPLSRIAILMRERGLKRDRVATLKARMGKYDTSK